MDDQSPKLKSAYEIAVERAERLEAEETRIAKGDRFLAGERPSTNGAQWQRIGLVALGLAVLVLGWIGATRDGRTRQSSPPSETPSRPAERTVRSPLPSRPTEQTVASRPSVETVLGRWKGAQSGGWNHSLTLKKKSAGVVMVDEIVTRSGERATIVEKLEMVGRYASVADRYDVLDNRFGEYFLVFDHGALEVRDSEGLIYTAYKAD
jgi:hypothetical protein